MFEHILLVVGGTLAIILVGVYLVYGILRPVKRRRMERRHHRDKKIQKR